MAFQDRDLTCRDCGGSFVFTGGEQEFYQTKGLQNDPVRCPACRATRKLMRPEDRDETPHYGVAVSWGGRTPRQLHVANCAQCGFATEVPFVPRGDRPVYCSNCYNDVRTKQEAQAEAEAEALASRLASRSDGPSLEGSATEREDEPESESVLEVEAVLEPVLAGAAEPMAETTLEAESEPEAEPEL